MKIIANTRYSGLKELLDELHDRFNRPGFIDSDPISVPHRFTEKFDIEIAGFFSAILAWGQRKQIIKNAENLMCLMDNAPYDFILNHEEADMARLKKFYYRTFRFDDLEFFLRALKIIYTNRGGLEGLFTNAFLETGNVKGALSAFYSVFNDIPHLPRSMKHVANVLKGSSAKRLNMYLRIIKVVS
ncbi:MAG: DUF2400 family protein [Bacteroidales bacterium]|nr:DUF2400 family protein [Bacteroidales bacterium]